MTNDSGIWMESLRVNFLPRDQSRLTQLANRTTLSTEKIKYFKLEVKQECINLTFYRNENHDNSLRC